jgi:hypothetical protein
MINKRGDLLHEELIFIILVIVFYSAMIIFSTRAGSGATFVEQTYAKKIALLIDQGKPGTTIELEVNDVFSIADKNKINRQETITINNEKNNVIVKADKGEGYSFDFFSENTIKWGLNTKTQKLVLEIV